MPVYYLIPTKPDADPTSYAPELVRRVTAASDLAKRSAVKFERELSAEHPDEGYKVVVATVDEALAYQEFDTWPCNGDPHTRAPIDAKYTIWAAYRMLCSQLGTDAAKAFVKKILDR